MEVRDPVCGMRLPRERAAASWTYEGREYRFCAVGCPEAFREDPRRFLDGPEADSGAAGGHRGG